MTNENPQKSYTVPIIITVVVLLIAAGAIFAYRKTKTTSNSYTQQGVEENANMLGDVDDRQSTGVMALSTGSTMHYPITELGVRLTIPTAIQDLIYVASADNKTLSFSTRSLKQAGGSFCAASAAPLGYISTDQQVLANREVSKVESDTMHEISPGVWAYYTHPQATCSADKDVQNLTLAQIDALQTAFKTIEVSPKI